MTTIPATIDTNQSQLSYGVETTWGTVPATTFNAIRYNGESLAMQKTRTRPGEISAAREVIQAVTTAVTAGGTVNYSLCFGVYEDFFASALNATWPALTSIAGVAGDIVLTNVSPTSCTITTATAGKFTAITQGSWIRTLGFVSSAGINNQIMYVQTKTSATSLTCTTTSPTVTETPSGVLAQIRQRNLRNGTGFTSLYLQQKYSSALWLRYAGSYVSGLTVTGGIGNYLTGAMTILSQSEASATVTADTGGIVASALGSVMNPIGGFGGVFWNEVSIGIVDSFTLNIASPGAALLYGMGSASAQSIMQGNLEVTGSIKMYFQNFTLYSQFLAETQGRLSIIAKDTSGQAYVFQLFNAFLNNPAIDAGGPNQAVFATFALEANPISGATTTIGIDALPAV